MCIKQHPYTNYIVLLFVLFCLSFSSINDNNLSGVASYYSDVFTGKKTASGQQYDKYKLTAAHRTLPLGTKIKVTRLDNGRAVVVKVNDRGPYVKGRIVDLSRLAAEKIGLTSVGKAQVQIDVIDHSNGVTLTEENLEELMSIIREEEDW